MSDESSIRPPTSEEVEKLSQLFANIREDLKRMVHRKLDRRLAGRVDASDVIQDTYMEACRRYHQYLASPDVPLVEWLRYLTVQSIQATHRFHLGRKKRDASRERADSSDLSVVRIVELISDSLTSPHSAAVREELRQAVARLINSMSEKDREVLRLRHEEQLSNTECAERIGIEASAASKRYLRAIERLRTLASDFV